MASVWDSLDEVEFDDARCIVEAILEAKRRGKTSVLISEIGDANAEMLRSKGYRVTSKKLYDDDVSLIEWTSRLKVYETKNGKIRPRTTDSDEIDPMYKKLAEREAQDSQFSREFAVFQSGGMATGEKKSK